MKKIVALLLVVLLALSLCACTTAAAQEQRRPLRGPRARRGCGAGCRSDEG